jgi:hypothetical protein
MENSEVCRELAMRDRSEAGGRGRHPPPSTPTAALPGPTHMATPGSADPLHHTTTFTPPPALAPGDMATPDAQQLFDAVSTPYTPNLPYYAVLFI